jgi:HAD superfamily hydrolase (TIGR01509 family)
VNLQSKVFILDFDGVITTLGIDWKDLLGKASRHAEIRISSFLDFFDKTWGTEKFQGVSSLVEQYELEAAMKVEPYADVKPALELLKQRNHLLYVASMQAASSVDYFLRKHEMEKYFKEVVTREKTGSKRRQLEYVKEKEANTEAKDFIFIDDSRRHILSYADLGFTCVYFNRQESGKTLLQVVQPFA